MISRWLALIRHCLSLEVLACLNVSFITFGKVTKKSGTFMRSRRYNLLSHENNY